MLRIAAVAAMAAAALAGTTLWLRHRKPSAVQHSG
jgi:hypothetical protein